MSDLDHLELQLRRHESRIWLRGYAVGLLTSLVLGLAFALGLYMSVRH